MGAKGLMRVGGYEQLVVCHKLLDSLTDTSKGQPPRASLYMESACWQVSVLNAR